MRLCERCGAVWVDLAELAEAALVAHTALDRMRLVVPGGVKIALVMVRDETRCYAGKCEAER